MSLLSGERQVAPDIAGISPDHVNRYRLASMLLRGTILDVACGVGYGAWTLSQSREISQVYAVDIDKEAIEYARQNYHDPKIEFSVKNLDTDPLPASLDGATALEIIEHIPRPEILLQHLCQHCPTLITSVPNENVIPFGSGNFPFHLRHYTWDEFEELVTTHYGNVKEYYFQKDKRPGELYKGKEEGRTLIIHAEAS